MLKILKQTREEERSMYDKLPKSMLIEMLINCNDVITILTQEKNCITPKEVKKDYEILSVIYDDKVYNKLNNIFLDENTNILENPLECPIHSVKRLSDKKEIFTIGDKCEKGIISSFSFFDNGLLIIYNNGSKQLLKNAVKSKVLFQTEDNVDIYEGDKYFQLAVSFSPNFREAIYEEIARPNIKYSYNCKEGKEQLNKNGRYYFSTKEAAEEYILMNKPCLSINDILSTPEGYSNNTKRLKELVKSKI